MTSPAIPLVRAVGSPFELGFSHGAARASALRAFLADDLCRLNRLLYQPVSLSALRPTIEAYAQQITAALPDLAEEIRGLAAGAGISWHEAVLLQIRREVLGYQKIPTSGECTTYARVVAGAAPVLAQTVDLNGDLDDQICVLHLGGPRSVLALSFGGLLGYLGLNSSGLAVGLNLVLGGDWRPGVPPYLAIRHVLDTADGVDEAVKILSELPLASSRSFLLCDRDQAGYLEAVGGQVRFVASPQPVHTNHILHADLVAQDEINVFAANSSRRRLDACRAALSRLPVDADPEDHFGLLSVAPICVDGIGDIRLDRTVAAIVARPDVGELRVRRGNPALSATQVFGLSLDDRATQPDTAEGSTDD